MNRPNDPSDAQRGGARPQLRGAVPPAQPRRQGVVDMPNLRRGPEASASPASRYPEGRRLVVGKDITLAGQISKCDFLIVEGMVEGMRYEGQSLEVTDGGSFSGTIEVENVDVSGIFEGTMDVKGRLTIRPTGRVSGTIRYGELEVNAGGQITGDIKVIEAVSRASSLPPSSSFSSGNSSSSGMGVGSDPDAVFSTSERMAGE